MSFNVSVKASSSITSPPVTDPFRFEYLEECRKIAYMKSVLATEIEVEGDTSFKFIARLWLSTRSLMSTFAYVVRRRIRPRRNSSSKLGLCKLHWAKHPNYHMICLHTLYLSEAFTAYPKSTKVCLEGGESSNEFAKHLNASRDVSQWEVSSRAKMHNVRIPCRKRISQFHRSQTNYTHLDSEDWFAALSFPTIDFKLF